MNNTVLIVVDSFKREYVGMKLLQYALRKQGFHAEVCGRYVLGSCYNKLRPDIVIVPKTHKVPELEEIHKHALVVLVQAESFVGCRDEIVSLSQSESVGWRADLVDVCCCWGEFDRRVFVEEEILPPDKVIITGHPNTDVWYCRPQRVKPTHNRLRVGITTSLRALTHVRADYNPVANICQLEKNGESGFFEAPYHAEARILYEATWIRVLSDIIQELKHCDIHLRPHPLERIDDYRYFEQYDNITVANKSHIIDWLRNIDVLLSYNSTSQLDAYIQGVKVISLAELFPRYVRDTLPGYLRSLPFNEHFYSPKSIDELTYLLTRRLADIDEFTWSDALDSWIKLVFNYPAENKASVAIAKHLHYTASSYRRTLGRDLFVNKEPFRPIKTNGRLPGKVGLVLRDLIGRPVDLTYCGHRLVRNWRQNQFVRSMTNGG